MCSDASGCKHLPGGSARCCLNDIINGGVACRRAGDVACVLERAAGALPDLNAQAQAESQERTAGAGPKAVLVCRNTRHYSLESAGW